MAVFKFGDGAGIPVIHEFLNKTTISVNHGLGYPPSVWIVIGGSVVFGDITHNNNMTFTIQFNNSESGVIYYR
jgi:hypothetical protein